MNGFRILFSKSKVWHAIGAGIGGLTAYTFIQQKIAVCESDFRFDPNVPVNLPTGFPKWDYDWDKRQPYSLTTKTQTDSGDKYHDKLEKNKAKVVRNLYIIRVGEYEEETPECDRKLTANGKAQAAMVAKRLEEISKQKKICFTSLVCASAPVACETAQIIQKNLGQKGLCISDKDPLLLEGCPSFPEPITQSLQLEPRQLYQDGSRIEAGFRKYFHRADPEQQESSYEIIVCDANVIRYFLCRALQFPGQAWLRMMIAHGSLNVISINPNGGVVLRAIGESGFMPPDKLTA